MVLDKKFYQTNTINLAKNLLGCFLWTNSKDGITVGRIVETEAYLHNDPAAHSFIGKTLRNFPLFGPPGVSYVYKIYGMYDCFNVSSNKEGVGEAVLIRALQPFVGIELMQKRRGIQDFKKLCSGPGKLTIALGITVKDSNKDLTTGRIRIYSREGFNKTIKTNEKIGRSVRIGITKASELPLRFYFKGNPFVSR